MYINLGKSKEIRRIFACMCPLKGRACVCLELPTLKGHSAGFMTESSLMLASGSTGSRLNSTTGLIKHSELHTHLFTWYMNTTEAGNPFKHRIFPLCCLRLFTYYW